ncbi:MAG: type II CAAX endopeptidase family protein [Verrucomicrobiota bacterium JB023]|nr:type II CAAX endopeptidase family protein [Verrucomicrobiota bacterium JB023]
MREFEYVVLGGAFTLTVLLLGVAAVLKAFSEKMPVNVGRNLGLVKTGQLGWLDFVGVGFVIIYYIGSWVAHATNPGQEDASVWMLLGQILVQASFAMVIVGMLFWRTRFEDFWGLRWEKWPIGLSLVLGGFLAFKCFSALLWVFGYEDWATEAYQRDEYLTLRQSQEPTVLTIFLWSLSTALVAPITEEIVFRGYIHPMLKRAGGIWLAVFTTSLFFAAAHMDGAGLLPFFMMGLLLSLAYEVSGSLWAPLGIHFLNNAYVVIVTLKNSV